MFIFANNKDTNHIMPKFDVTILGCGSATPTLRHLGTSQLIDIRDKLYMVDCAEGTQIQMRRVQARFGRLGHIFISHLHGDHCFGLPGLISTLGLLGRKGDLVIHGPKGLDDFLEPTLSVFCKDLPYTVKLHIIDPSKHELVMEDRSITVHSIPLNHRIPACGYLFSEKPSDANLIRDMIDFYKIPVRALAGIKQGDDFITSEGVIVSNNRLTRPAKPPKRYAFCSDTSYLPQIVPLIENVDCLYHESTFLEKDLPRAQLTFHSTAKQAAQIALQANVKRLYIGHYSARYVDLQPFLDEARAVFPETYLSIEELVIPVSSL